MSTKTLNVTWDDHLQNLSGLFQDLYENKKLCDVTLYCSGGTLLKAHKIVLSACSPYFSKIFQEIDIKHPVIILKGVTYDEMHQLLEFMYKGSINILEQDLACLIQAGSYLEIKGMNAKNIPNNMKGSLKRTCDDTIDPLVDKMAKKPKDDLTRIAEQGRVVSRESSPASATGVSAGGVVSTPSSSSSSRRETRFKGQKRVDVKFKSSLGTSSPVNTGGGATARKKDADDDGTDDKHTKGKINKKTTNANIKVENKSYFNKNKNTPDKKPITVQSEIPVSVEKEKDKDKEKEKNEMKTEKKEENGSVSNLVIKDVYSTGDETLNKIHGDDEDDYGGDVGGDDDDDDDIEDEELEDENLVFPDVSFREADGEIVTQSDDEAIQRSSHLARHRRKHIGDRPYECKTCGKAFSRSDKLRTHCRQAHDDDYKPPPHLKKKYEFIEFTGDLFEKKGRGRPRKFPLRDPPPRPSLDGQKRGRGRPRKMSCPAPGEPVENYDITNLPFGDFSYLTEAITMQAAQEPETTYHDISIIPVSTCSTTNIQQHQQQQQQQQQQQLNTDINTTNTSTTNINTKIQEDIQVLKTNEENIKSNELISNIRQIGECTIQPVAK